MLSDCRISGFADEINKDFDIQLSVLKELGQEYVELRSADGTGVADLSLEMASELGERMKAAGIRVSSVGSPIGKIKITDDFEPHFETYRHVVELAKLWGVRYIRMFSFYIPEGEDPAQYKEITGKRMEPFLAFLELLQHKNKKLWLRTVIVPGINNEPSQIAAIQKFANRIKNVEKIEFLPYHKMGVQKYQKLGISYPLEGTPELTEDEIQYPKGL